MKQRTAVTVLSLVCSIVATGKIVFDFETDREINGWRVRSPATDKFIRTADFGTSGAHSGRFTTPAWKKGMEQWPAFEARPPTRDWRGYDRLVVDVVNPNREAVFLSLFISDGKVPFREGLGYGFDLPTLGFRRFTIPLSRFPDKVDRADIAIIHFFLQRPKHNTTLYVDNIRLLKKGERVPPPAPALARQLAAMLLRDTHDLETVRDECRAVILDLADSAELRRGIAPEIARIEKRLAIFRGALQSPDISYAEFKKIRTSLADFVQLSARHMTESRFRHAFDRLGFAADSPMLVGFASSMEKVLPGDMPFRLNTTRSVSVELARNEKEAIQVAVMPRAGKLTGVRIRVRELRLADGTRFPEDRIDSDVVGYVRTRKRPPYDAPYVGWWPDPILDFLGPVDIAAGDLQTFWVRFRTPGNCVPGDYHGKIEIVAANAPVLSFDLVVTVHSFVLPDHTPLPTAITFFERKSQMGGEKTWRRMKFQYADFLADYCIDYDSLYRKGPPDFEIVEALAKTGRLTAFNLGNVFNGGIRGADVDGAIAKTVERLRPAYEQAKKRGLLDYAYIYGFDERGKDQFPLLQKCAKALHEAFPEVLLLTTGYDHSFGLDSCVKDIDAWCPLTPRFDPVQAEKARRTGRFVWWYICCGPKHPYANWFIEYPAIDARLLMGAMTARYRPDGFLYYSLSIWNRNKPIETGPFTDWDPVSWTTYHGDGSLLCSGPGGKPVPTIRLENYRDGMEDFAYACLLREAVRRMRSKPVRTPQEGRWLTDADSAIRVPDNLVKDLKTFSRNPALLYAWRHRMAQLIDACGLRNLDPWGPAFGVRGFRGRSQRRP